MKIDHTNASRVESGLRPPMKTAITLPVLTDQGEDTGICIYVCESAFRYNVADNPRLMKEIAAQIAVAGESFEFAQCVRRFWDEGPEFPLSPSALLTEDDNLTASLQVERIFKKYDEV